MKIRTGYVSNSSSSSYVIAYDKSFFGDLEKLFMNDCDAIGCETVIYDIADIDEEFYNCELGGDKDEIKKFKEKMKEKEKEGKSFLYIRLDHDYEVIISLLKLLNENNGGDKIEFLYNCG